MRVLGHVLASALIARPRDPRANAYRFSLVAVLRGAEKTIPRREEVVVRGQEAAWSQSPLKRAREEVSERITMVSRGRGSYKSCNG